MELDLEVVEAEFDVAVSETDPVPFPPFGTTDAQAVFGATVAVHGQLDPFALIGSTAVPPPTAKGLASAEVSTVMLQAMPASVT
jgi:hypothetical protein